MLKASEEMCLGGLHVRQRLPNWLTIRRRELNSTMRLALDAFAPNANYCLAGRDRREARI